MAEISDEAVEAAWATWLSETGSNLESMRAALTAALPFLEAAIRQDQREKDAQVADASANDWNSVEDGTGQQSQEIAAAIRQGGKE